MNPAFKHLDSKLRIGDLTIRQWLGILAGGVIALVYGEFLHPFNTTVTLISAVYIGGLPIAAMLVAGFSEFDVWLVMRCALQWRSADERYLPGPGATTVGYHVRAAMDELGYGQHEQLSELDPACLWGEQ